MTSRILIVDDHEIVREGIRTLLSRSRPEWEIVGEAVNGQLAIEAVKNLKPDVVILDVTMPVMSGLEAVTVTCSRLCASWVILILPRSLSTAFMALTMLPLG